MSMCRNGGPGPARSFILLLRGLAAGASLIVLLVGSAQAQPAPAPADAQPGETREPVWDRAGGARVALFPAGNVYDVYVADPHRPSNAILERFYSKTDIPDSKTPRTSMAVGGSFGLLRIDTAGSSGRSWQVSLDAGLDALFDAKYKLDGIGWEGNYGLTFETASRSPLSYRAAVLHVSSHLGDEYALRNGLNPINYTREEFAFGTAWRFSPAWRAYGEAGIAWTLRNDSQEPWRVQAGLEWEGRPSLWGGRFAWYGALDLQSMQERGWRVDPTLQAGIVTRSRGRAYRLLIEYLDGRPTIANFYDYDEAHFTIGFKMDL